MTENQVSFPWFPLASEPDAVSAYTEFISKLCELAIKLKRVALKDKEVENTEFNMCKADVKWQRQELEETQNTECYAEESQFGGMENINLNIR